MTDDQRVEAVLAAVAAAMVGEGADVVVDLAKLEDELAAAGINCTATTNRGALASELGFLREELRTQRTRLANSDEPRRAGLRALVAQMDGREVEITELLWPK